MCWSTPLGQLLCKNQEARHELEHAAVVAPVLVIRRRKLARAYMCGAQLVQPTSRIKTEVLQHVREQPKVELQRKLKTVAY